MKLSIIIVSYNVKYFVEQCVCSVLKSTENIETEIFVVDNMSSDETIPYLAKAFPGKDYPNIHLIANKENVGFGRANNQALTLSSGEFVLFLNPDTIVTESTLTDCLDFAEKKEDLGAMGVYMQRSNGSFALESRRGMPTLFTSFCKMSGLSSIFPKSKIFGKYYMRYLDEKEVAEIDVVSGAFMFVPRKSIEKSGAFDEDFFMYGEDIDLSFRLKKTGFKNYYLPTPILHYKGESTEKTSYQYVRVFYEAMLIFFKKHYRNYSLLFTCSVCLAIYTRGIVAFLWQRINRLNAFFRKRIAIRVLYTFIGDKEMLKQAESLSRKNEMDSRFIEADKNADLKDVFDVPLQAGVHHYIVFDTENFSYKSILRYFQEQKNPNISIGTYSVKTRVIITDYITLYNER